MRVSVVGLGYVGSVSAANFAADGHDVVGVDVHDEKVNAINEGRSPIVEPGLGELLEQGRAAGRLRATTSMADAVRDTELSLVCVGTPSRKNGSLDLTYLERVAEQIGAAIKGKSDYHVVVVRSTVLPGTTHGMVIPALERTSGKKYGEGFGVAVNPEFLREGTALKDFRQPPLTLVGHNHAADAAPTTALYDGIEAPLYSTSIRVAEMMKYTSNTWHAVKVVFANEIGNLCKRVGIDSHEVMDIFCKDDKLNLSPYYLKARLRVRRLVPSQGRAGTAVPGEGSRPRHADDQCGADQQPAAGAARDRSNRRDGQEEDRAARLQLQGGHRRPA
jgi:GDP-mannose 6-dehydrogenase